MWLGRAVPPARAPLFQRTKSFLISQIVVPGERRGGKASGEILGRREKGGCCPAKIFRRFSRLFDRKECLECHQHQVILTALLQQEVYCMSE